MSEGQKGTENALEMLTKAEVALASGNFMRANRISRDTSKIIDRTQSLHRKFMKKMKGFIEKITDMEGKGYDISEAMQIMNRAKERAMKADYNKAMKTMNLVKPALERATYTPFPLLNKTVDIISIIFYSKGKVSYTVRIENPTEEPLGEIIMRPYFSTDEFNEVSEKAYGIIGAREYKEYTFFLQPKKGKKWSLGVGSEILMEEGVTLRTKLSSREGEAIYLVVIENNSDQIIRDVVVAPQTPGGLKSDPPSGLIEIIEPFSTGSVTFDLSPGSLDQSGSSNDRIEKVYVVEDETAYEPTGHDEFEITGEVEDTNEDNVDDEEFSFEEDLLDEEIYDRGEPKDFTPVMEKYNLIEMAPSRYPKDVEGKMRKSRKKKEE